jgi:mannose-6-phosphate isomerase-like protein (cupin superfamily)
LRLRDTAGLTPAWSETPGKAVRYLATGAAAGGQLGLYRWDLGPQRGGPGPHFHRTISESFVILSGTVRLYDGARWVSATEGDFRYVPQGGIHGFRNESRQPASMLLSTPGAPREEYFETLAEVAQGRRALSDEERAALMIRHDTFGLD